MSWQDTDEEDRELLKTATTNEDVSLMSGLDDRYVLIVGLAALQAFGTDSLVNTLVFCR